MASSGQRRGRFTVVEEVCVVPPPARPLPLSSIPELAHSRTSTYKKGRFRVCCISKPSTLFDDEEESLLSSSRTQRQPAGPPAPHVKAQVPSAGHGLNMRMMLDAPFPPTASSSCSSPVAGASHVVQQQQHLDVFACKDQQRALRKDSVCSWDSASSHHMHLVPLVTDVDQRMLASHLLSPALLQQAHTPRTSPRMRQVRFSEAGGVLACTPGAAGSQPVPVPPRQSAPASAVASPVAHELLRSDSGSSICLSNNSNLSCAGPVVAQQVALRLADMPRTVTRTYSKGRFVVEEGVVMSPVAHAAPFDAAAPGIPCKAWDVGSRHGSSSGAAGDAAPSWTPVWDAVPSPAAPVAAAVPTAATLLAATTQPATAPSMCPTPMAWCAASVVSCSGDAAAASSSACSAICGTVPSDTADSGAAAYGALLPMPCRLYMHAWAGDSVTAGGRAALLDGLQAGEDEGQVAAVAYKKARACTSFVRRGRFLVQTTVA